MPRLRATSARSSALRSLGRAAMEAFARVTPSASRSIRRSESPVRLASFFPPAPRMSPKPTCTASDAVGQIAGKAGDVEHETQMERLFGPHDVDQRGGAPALRAVADARQVRGGVAVAPVGLAHDQGERIALPVGEAFGEDAERAVVLDQQALARPTRPPPRRARGCTSSHRPRRHRSGGPPTSRRPRRCGAGSRPRRSPRAAVSRDLPLGAAPPAGGSARRMRGHGRSGGGPGRRTR